MSPSFLSNIPWYNKRNFFFFFCWIKETKLKKKKKKPSHVLCINYHNIWYNFTPMLLFKIKRLSKYNLFLSFISKLKDKSFNQCYYIYSIFFLLDVNFHCHIWIIFLFNTLHTCKFSIWSRIYNYIIYQNFKFIYFFLQFRIMYKRQVFVIE